MTRKEKEKLVIELNIAVSKLLERYQWDHIEPQSAAVEKQLQDITEKLNAVKQSLLDTENTE